MQHYCKNELENSTDDAGRNDALLAVLNNYYDFLGLEYNQDYFRLSNMLLALKNGEIDEDEIKSTLAGMNKSGAVTNNEKQVQNNKQASSGYGNYSTSQNNASSSGNNSQTLPQTQQQNYGQQQGDQSNFRF